MKNTTLNTMLRRAALGTLAVFFVGQPALRAADHRDAPVNAFDAGTDLADVYLFEDPVVTSNLVLVATFHGFIVPGEAGNEAIFDQLVNLRFEVYNDHVNDAAAPPSTDKPATRKFLARIKPARTIDVTFEPRFANPGPAGKEILRVPQPQAATLKFTGFRGQTGFTGVTKKDTISGLPVLNPSLADTSPDPATGVTSNITLPNSTTATGISFFAGEVDDPFFFDIPAFSRFVADVRNGLALTTAAGQFSRGRDTFAGYNALAVALSIPKAALLNADSGKTKIGLNVIAQRHKVEMPPSPKTGVTKGVGVFSSVDRQGNPAINVALIPFERKNEYNASTPKDDAAGRFAGDVVATLKALNPDIDSTTTNPPGTLGALANVAVFFGDLLVLDTATPAAWPNGRKPADDVIDTVLTLIANIGDGMGGRVTVKDNVDGNDVPFETAFFPYLGKTQQPRPRGGALPAPDTNLDDNTRN